MRMQSESNPEQGPAPERLTPHSRTTGPGQPLPLFLRSLAHRSTRSLSQSGQPANPVYPHTSRETPTPPATMVKLPTGFSRQQVSSLLSRVHKTHCGCPMCSSLAAAAANSPADILNAANAIRTGGRAKVLHRAPSAGLGLPHGARGYATPVDAPQGDYAFEVAASNLRFGEGVTKVRSPGGLLSLPSTLRLMHCFAGNRHGLCEPKGAQGRRLHRRDDRQAPPDEDGARIA